jgi:hypothetical protein
MEDAGVMAPTVQDGWLVWEVPGKPISVRLSLDVVSRLGMAVHEGFKALPRRGLEIGGLLLGTARDAGNLTVVDVDDFEPVESEHATGPSYVLSDADRRLLKDRIAARQASTKLPLVVGFYRSHSRKDFAITAEDASLFSTYCPKTSDVFLLIKSNEVGPPTGGFIIREGGQVLSDSPYAQFTLDWTLGIRAAREVPVRAVQISPPPPLSHMLQPPQPPRIALPMRAAPAARWPSWLVTAGALGLAVGLSFAILRRPPAPIPANTRPLALNVTAAGNGLRLSWDHQSSRPTGHAVLWIKDGQDEQRFELDSKQLSEGSVTYWPRNSDVTFRLVLQSGSGASVTESVRSIGGPSKAPQIVPAPAPEAVAVRAAPTPAVKAPHAEVRAPKPSHQTNRIGSASRQLSHTFVLPRPETASTPVTPARLPDPPVIQPVAPAPQHNKEFFKPTMPANSLDSADSSIRVRVEPVPSSRLERLTRSLPLIGKRYRRPDYVPPAVLRNPGLTSPPQRSVSREVNIDVKVYVNPAGKVDYSEVLSKVAEPDRDLAASALFSARRWEFTPARDSDGTVPGEVILHYQFGPGARSLR